MSGESVGSTNSSHSPLPAHQPQPTACSPATAHHLLTSHSPLPCSPAPSSLDALYIYTHTRIQVDMCMCLLTSTLEPRCDATQPTPCVLSRLCMDVWMYGCMHAHVHACMHACTRACMHMCMHACMHVRVRVTVSRCLAYPRVESKPGEGLALMCRLG